VADVLIALLGATCLSDCFRIVKYFIYNALIIIIIIINALHLFSFYVITCFVVYFLNSNIYIYFNYT